MHLNPSWLWGGNGQQDHWERGGMARWHKMTFIVFTQINMISFAPRPYLQMRDAEVQIVGDRFVCNVSWKYWGFILTICLLGFILLFCFHLKVLLWPCQLQLLSFQILSISSSWMAPSSIQLSILLWPGIAGGPLARGWKTDRCWCWLPSLPSQDAHRLCENSSHVSQHIVIAKNIPLHCTTPVF